MAWTYEQYMRLIKDVEIGLNPIFLHIYKIDGYGMPKGAVSRVQGAIDELKNISPEEFEQKKEDIKPLLRRLKKTLRILCGVVGYPIPDHLISKINTFIEFL